MCSVEGSAEMEVLTYRQISFNSTLVARPDRPFPARSFEAVPYPYVDGSTRVTEFDEKPIVRQIILEEPGLPAAGRPVLEEFLLPTVEHRRPQSKLATELGNRLLFQQMPPQNGDRLFSAVMLSWFRHALSLLS